MQIAKQKSKFKPTVGLKQLNFYYLLFFMGCLLSFGGLINAQNPFITEIPLREEGMKDLIVVKGENFGDQPQNVHGSIFVADKILPLLALSANDNEVVFKLPPIPIDIDGEDGLLTIDIGEGSSVPINPTFDDITINQPTQIWVRGNVGTAFDSGGTIQAFGDPDVIAFHNAPLTGNGTISLVINKDYNEEERMTVLVKMNTPNDKEVSYYIPEVTFAQDGTALDRAERICDLLVQTSNNQLNCQVTGTPEEATITLQMTDGMPIESGAFTVTHHAPRPVILDVEQDAVGEGDEIVIHGKHFDLDPKNLCVFLMNPNNNRLIGIAPKEVQANKIVGKLEEKFPKDADGIPHAVMLANGKGEEPNLALKPDVLDKIIIKERGVLKANAFDMKAAQKMVVPKVAGKKDNLPSFLSNGPENGTLSVIINQPWGVGMDVCISSRIHHENACGWDTYFRSQFLTANGTAEECAALIGNLIQEMMAAHNRPLQLNTEITPVAGGAKLTLSMANGLTITQGYINIEVKAIESCRYEMEEVEMNCQGGDFLVCLNATEIMDDVSGLGITFTHPESITATEEVIYGDVIDNSTGGNLNWLGNYFTYPQAGKTKVSLFFTGDAPANATLNGAGSLACFQFSATEAIDEESFEIGFKIEEAYLDNTWDETCVLNGIVDVDLTAAKGVQLEVWANDLNSLLGNSENPITSISATNKDCQILEEDIATLDATGYFEVDPTVDFVQISRLNPNCELPFGVIEGSDIIDILRIVGETPGFVPSILQLISADTDQNGVVNPGDVSLAIARANALDANDPNDLCEYPLGIMETVASDWIFIPQNILDNDPAFGIDLGYPNNTDDGADRRNVPLISQCLELDPPAPEACEVVTTDIVALFKGDLDEPDGSGGFKKEASNVTFYLDLDKTTRIDQEHYQIPIFIDRETTTPLTSLSFELTIDPQKYFFEGVDRLDNSFTVMEDNYAEEVGKLRVMSLPSVNIPVDEPILELILISQAEELCIDDFSDFQASVNGDLVLTEVLLQTDCIQVDDIGGPTAIDTQILSNFQFTVYPNPARDKVILTHTPLEETAEIRFLGTLGKQIKAVQVPAFQNRHVIDLSQMNSGIYFIQLIQEGFVLTTSKLIVE